MAFVVFLRGVNVGGNKKFQPSVLAKELVAFQVTNVGAAGTFIIHKNVGEKSIREKILQKLPFQAELMICPAQEIIAMGQASNLFGKVSPGKDLRPFVSIMSGSPKTLPHLPIDRPAGDQWEVRIINVIGKYAFSLLQLYSRA